MSSGSAAVVDTIEQLARAVVADEASAAAVADAARLQTMLRRARTDGAQRAARARPRGRSWTRRAAAVRAAGCSSMISRTACRDLNGSTAPARREPAGLLRRAAGRGGAGAGTRGARAREAVLAQQPARPRSPSPAGPGGARGRPVLEDFALQLLREECAAVRAVPRDLWCRRRRSTRSTRRTGDRRTKTGARGLPRRRTSGRRRPRMSS